MKQTVVRQIGTVFAFAGLLLLVSGCGGQPSAPVTKLPPNAPGGAATGNAGGPPPPENRPVAAMGGGPAPAAGAPAAPPAEPSVAETLGPTDIFGNPLSPRERPVAAMGGGGAPAAGGPPSAASSNSNNRPGGNASGSSPIGLANGLYPQGMTGSGGGSPAGGSIAGGLQNGLYPQFTSAGAPSSLPSGSAAAGGAPPAAASALAGDTTNGSGTAAKGAATEFFENAKKLYNEGDENAAARNLYAYLLAKEDAFEEYPLQWFTGLKQPRAFLRIGVGVTYSRPRDFDGKPPVLGDPVANERGGGRRGNAAPDSGDGILGASGANPGGAGGGSNSPYANVDTGTPAGFLLYYTGDYIEKLYQELNTRRKGSKTQFGKLLAQFPERTPSAPKTNSQNENVSSQPFPPQGGPPANRPTIALGGGPGGGGGPPAGGAGGGGAGGGGGSGDQANNGNANRTARNARKLVDLWSGSDASAPERLTTGTLTPGVLCLGEGKKDELFSRAKKFGVDVILLFDVKVGEARGENYSTTTLRLFNVENPEEQLALGRQLRSNTVMEAREGGKADPVAGELARVVEEYMDQNLAAQDLPNSLTQENVTKRIEAVLAGDLDDPLKLAVEVVGFYRVGLLPEDKVVEALNKLLGEDLTEAILNGNEGERVNQLRKLAEDD
ncbi:MAG: hypothetical protein ACK6DB_08920 [Planctomycetota bacterium]